MHDFQTRLLCTQKKPCLHPKEALFLMQRSLLLKVTIFLSDFTPNFMRIGFDRFFKMGDIHTLAKNSENVRNMDYLC